MIRPDGTGVRQVTNEDAGPQDLAWSADGKRVLFTNSYTSQLVEVDVESRKSSTLMLTNDAHQPAVALRGERLAYARSFQNVNIWGTSLDPSNQNSIGYSSHPLVCKGRLIYLRTERELSLNPIAAVYRKSGSPASTAATLCS